MANLFIIGNGFDLAHEYKTHYTDFVKYVTNHLLNEKLDNIFPQLLSYSNKPQTIKYDGIISEYNNNPETLPYYLTFHNKFFELIFTEIADKTWSDIEELYYRNLKMIYDNTPYNIDKVNPDCPYKSILELNKDFDKIKLSLSTYLAQPEILTDAHFSSFQELFKLSDSNQCAIMNFNYTNTLSTYLKNSKSELINVHGQNMDKNNPIIFGYGAVEAENRKLIDNGDNGFVENIKQSDYGINGGFNKMINFLNANNKIEVSIIGHSCGNSDTYILNRIFNHEKVDKIRIMYRNQTHYKRIKINIDRIMNNPKRNNIILDLPDCPRFPNYNDDQNLISNFEQYIRTNITKGHPPGMIRATSI